MYVNTTSIVQTTTWILQTLVVIHGTTTFCMYTFNVHVCTHVTCCGIYTQCHTPCLKNSSIMCWLHILLISSGRDGLLISAAFRAICNTIVQNTVISWHLLIIAVITELLMKVFGSPPKWNVWLIVLKDQWIYLKSASPIRKQDS